MKSVLVLFLAVFSGFLLSSCESTQSLRAGGGAFDESELAKQLDANSHLPDPDTPRNRSYEEWRNNE